MTEPTKLMQKLLAKAREKQRYTYTTPEAFWKICKDHPEAENNPFLWGRPDWIHDENGIYDDWCPKNHPPVPPESLESVSLTPKDQSYPAALLEDKDWRLNGTSHMVDVGIRNDYWRMHQMYHDFEWDDGYDGNLTLIAQIQKRNNKMRKQFTALLMITLRETFSFRPEQFSTLWKEMRNLDESVQKKFLKLHDFVVMFQEECDMDITKDYPISDDFRMKQIQEELLYRQLMALAALHTKLGFGKEELKKFSSALQINKDDLKNGVLSIYIDKKGMMQYTRKQEETA